MERSQETKAAVRERRTQFHKSYRWERQDFSSRWTEQGRGPGSGRLSSVMGTLSACVSPNGDLHTLSRPCRSRTEPSYGTLTTRGQRRVVGELFSIICQCAGRVNLLSNQKKFPSGYLPVLPRRNLGRRRPHSSRCYQPMCAGHPCRAP